MTVQEIPIRAVDVSAFNARKDLTDGQFDSTIEDLAKSIQKHGLLSPVTVVPTPEGRYALVAGQRRFLACKQLGQSVIAAIVRDAMSETAATTVSLVENVHRADMNPLDKAKAFAALRDSFGDLQNVSRETGVGVTTIRKYIRLLDLSPQLQQRLAAGEAKNTDALAQLAQREADPDKQQQVWERVNGFTQDVQREIIKRVDDELDNLEDLVDDALEGAFERPIVRNCPFDCPRIPPALRQPVADMIAAHAAPRGD